MGRLHAVGHDITLVTRSGTNGKETLRIYDSHVEIEIENKDMHHKWIIGWVCNVFGMLIDNIEY